MAGSIPAGRIRSQNKEKLYRLGGNYACIEYGEYEDIKKKRGGNEADKKRHTICISDGCLEEIAEYESKERCIEVLDEIQKICGQYLYAPGNTGLLMVQHGDTEKTVWCYLAGMGLNAFAVAGIMGNLYAESGLNPCNLQNSYNKSLDMTDAEYTKAVDNGSYENFVNDKAGYGLAQWTYYTRKQALLDYARAVGESIGSLVMQLDFLWHELQSYNSVISVLNNAGTVRAASDAVLLGYERPADQSEAAQAKRAGYGETYYNKYAGMLME